MGTRVAAVTSVLVGSLAFAACGDPYASNADSESWGPGGKGDETGATLRYRSYDVMFTNPVCRDYTYAEPMPTADGSTTLTQKPKNVYCTSDDAAASAARPSSPQNKLLEWVRPLGEGDEIFLAYLSFSNRVVGEELCQAAQRGAKVTFVLDKTSEQSAKIEACGATVLLRGNVGSIGYAHNKLVLINPRAPGASDDNDEFMRMSFSSGNMSSGVVTHHENWHFVEAARDGYFAQAHACMMAAQLDEEIASNRGSYRDSINACRNAIEAPEEDDIKAFFIPNRDDSRRATRYLLGGLDEAAHVDLGAHRFAHPDLVDKLDARLAEGLTLRMVADDDLYWVDRTVLGNAEVGPNLAFEADNVQRLEATGGDGFEIRYFETNHGQHLLHHNKYLIYRTAAGAPFAVLAGAANLTKAGFNDNFENIYFIKVPAVLEAFDTQFRRVWDGELAETDEQDPPIATPRHLMPLHNVPGV